MNTLTSRSGYPDVRRMRTLRTAAFVSIVLGFFTLAVQAANGTWNVDAAGNWSTTTNWLGGLVAGNKAGDVANLTFNLTAARTVTVDGTNKIIGVLNIGDRDNTHAYTLGGGTSVYFNNGASDAQINQTATSKGDTISDPIAIAGNGKLTLTNASANTLTVSAYTASGSTGAKTLTINNTGAVNYTGPLSNGGGGALALVKSGTGALTVGGVNSHSGGTTLNAGTLNIATYNGQALGTGAFTVNGGTINNTYGGPLTIANNVVQNWNANIAFTGTQDLNLGTGAVTMNASRTVTVTAKTLTVGGGIAGTGFALTKAGAGTLVLNGANTYTGVTTISAGKVQFGKKVSLYNGEAGSWSAANLVVNSGTTAAFNVGGTGEFASTDIDTLKALGTAAGGFKSGSTLCLDTANATGGVFTYASVIANPNAGANVLNLVKQGANILALSGANTYTGTTALSAGTLAINTASAIGTGTLTITGGALDNTSGSAVILTSNNAQNWNGNFAFTGTSDLNLGTGAVAMNASRTVTVNASTLTVGGVVSGAFGLSKAGVGTLALNGANTYTGPTTINGGVLSVTTLANGGVLSSIGASTNAATCLVIDGGTLRYTGAAASTDRSFTLGTTPGSAIDSSGTGVITFTGSCTLSGTNTARTLTLTGTNAGSNTLAAVIADNGTGATSLVKSGPGQWWLTGSNTCTGGTTITGGTLTVSATGSIGSGNVTITGGGLVLSNASAFKSNATFTFSPLMAAGSINLNFTGAAAISSLGNGTLNAIAGTYTAAQLNTFFGTSIFTGTGSLTVGSWVTVPLGGGGFVSGLACNSTGTDIYCRTDVGGAFRWVPAVDGLNGSWLSITDTLVPTTTPGSEGATNTSSIAVDPNNANNLYVSVGTPYSSVTGIYASTDRGATWTKINSVNPIVMDGNGTYRGVGERLAVDPNNSNIVWFGSTQNGLQKGVNSGGNWTWTQVPSTSVPFGQVVTGDKAGVTFVVCDKNGGRTITYAGVFDSVGATGGVYKSTDGTTWSKVAGVTIATPRRAQIASNGTLYVTGYQIVGRLLRGGSLTAVTPSNGLAIGYFPVAVDPNDATGNTVYVGEGNNSVQYNKIWRSTNGGGNWTTQYQNLNDNSTIARTEPDGTTTLTGYWFGGTAALLVNPANSNELWASDYFGVARTRNAQLLGGAAVGSQAVWYMLQKNQEEVCVETLKNAPTGPELMTGVADVGGFRYNDISQRPYGAAGNSFTNPSEKNNTSLDFHEPNPDIWVRSWTGDSGVFGTGAHSKDGGVTWVSFGQVDGRLMTVGAAGWETFDLTTYLATQKAKGNNIVTLMLSSGYPINPIPGDDYVLQQFTSKEYGTTTLRPKLVVNGSITLSPTDDATVLPFFPNNNYGVNGSYGAYGTIEVAFNGKYNDWYRHAYLKFDLTNIPSVSSATLSLYRLGVLKASQTGNQVPLGLFACSDTNWNQGTLTWNNHPIPYSSSVSQPYNDPRYTTVAGVSLSGGRVAISSTNPNALVWMPFGHTTVPHYSNDRGVTWTPCVGLPTNVNWLYGKSNPGYLLQQLTADRVNGDFYIEHLWNDSGAAPYKQIYKSTNGGANWTLAGSIPYGANYVNNIYRTQIVAAPAAGHVWVSDDGITNAAMGGLWKSINGGTSSVQFANITGVRVVAFGKPKPNQTTYLYSAYFMGYYNSVKGIYRSDDYGATWTSLPALPSDVSVECIAGDRQVYGSVFFGTGGRGVFQTQ